MSAILASNLAVSVSDCSIYFRDAGTDLNMSMIATIFLPEDAACIFEFNSFHPNPRIHKVTLCIPTEKGLVLRETWCYDILKDFVFCRTTSAFNILNLKVQYLGSDCIFLCRFHLCLIIWIEKQDEQEAGKPYLKESHYR